MNDAIQQIANFIENYDLNNIEYIYERDWHVSWSDPRNDMTIWLYGDKFCVKISGYASLDDNRLDVIATNLQSVELRKYTSSWVDLLCMKLFRNHKRATEFVDSISRYEVFHKKEENILKELWQPSKKIMDYCFSIAKSPQLIAAEEIQRKIEELI